MPSIKKLTINGRAIEVSAEEDRPLLDLLREDLGLTGAKYGCGEGRCGACTVLVDGAPVRSCVTALKTVSGAEITTIEGLEHDGKLHPVQQAFLDCGAMQCGYCTCGMIMSAVGLLRKNPRPHPRGSHRTDERQHLPLRYLSANHHSPLGCRQGAQGGRPMIDSTQTPVDIEPERYELFEGPRFQFAVDRRGFLKSLGGGILVLHLLNNANAEQQPRGRRGGRGGGGQTAPREIAAWLHINEDGRVTVYTGKAEVGQNIRTSLTQVVAEELHTAPASIHLVMADTHLTPFDMGTFGSRTTPDMSQRLRRTAAAARELLIDLAAESWKAERAMLKAEGGNIVHSGTGQKVEFGKLTKGQKLTKTVADETAPTPPDSWTIAGHSEPKVDGRSFVTGQHQYTSDLKLPGMLYGKVLRPPSLGATLASVDLTGAKSLTGVVVVQDGDFIGVTAPSSFLASRALAAIKADWKPGPPLSARDLFDSLKPQGRKVSGDRETAGRPAGSAGNGRETTGIHLEQTYTIAYIAHAPLEPRAAVARLG